MSKKEKTFTKTIQVIDNNSGDVYFAMLDVLRKAGVEFKEEGDEIVTLTVKTLDNE